jgi:hypothetical protein
MISGQTDPRVEPEEDDAGASRPTANVNAGWYKRISSSIVNRFAAEIFFNGFPPDSVKSP